MTQRNPGYLELSEDTRKSARNWLIVGGTVIGGLLLASALSTGPDPRAPEPAATATAESAIAAESAVPPIDVTPARLVADFAENEIAARSTYGRPLRVAGKVNKVIVNNEGIPVLVLEHPNGFARPLVPFPGNGAELAGLRAGQAVALACRSADSTGRRVVLMDCQMQGGG